MQNFILVGHSIQLHHIKIPIYIISPEIWAKKRVFWPLRPYGPELGVVSTILRWPKVWANKKSQ